MAGPRLGCKVRGLYSGPPRMLTQGWREACVKLG